MKVTRIFAVAIATLGLAGYSGVASADAAAGKAKFNAACAECHEAGDFGGESAADLSATMKKMVAGQQKHKTALKLSDAEIANIAAYLAAGGK
jgi:mono/diheme cytochrome c family protein